MNLGAETRGLIASVERLLFILSGRDPILSFFSSLPSSRTLSARGAFRYLATV